MLAIFRTNQLIVGFLLLFYVVLLRFPVFLVPPAWEPHSIGILTDWLYQWIGNKGGVADIVAIIVLFVQAIILNGIVNQHRLAKEVTLFPGVFYIMIASLFPEFTHLSPLLLANTFYIIALGELMATYQRNTCADRIFNAGFWIGVASLFYFSYIVFLILGFISLLTMRAFRVSETLTLIIGAIVPYFLLGVGAFWFDGLNVFIQKQLSENLAFLDLNIPLEWSLYAQAGVIGLLIIVVLLSFRTYTSKQNIQTQKKLSILYWAIIIPLFSLLIQNNIQFEHLLMLAVPLGIFLSLNFVNMPRQWAETLHLIMVIAVIVWHFKPYFILPG